MNRRDHREHRDGLGGLGNVYFYIKNRHFPIHLSRLCVLCDLCGSFLPPPFLFASSRLCVEIFLVRLN